MHKVLITTSGTGSRLGELTKAKNKALVTVGGKTVIERIVELYPVDTQFVVTIGYFGAQVREFLLSTYPARQFEFIEVDKFTGEGSSLGYSMLCAKEVLQCPFVFHCNDTLVAGEVPPLTDNWIGVYDEGSAAQYSTWKLVDNVPRFQDKGATDFDHIHIGLVGIKDYAQYWDILTELYATHPEDQGLNDCKVLTRMVTAGAPFRFVSFAEWFDTGNPVALAKAEAGLSA